MAWKRHTTEQIIEMRKAEVKLSQGRTVDHSPFSIDQLRFG